MVTAIPAEGSLYPSMLNRARNMSHMYQADACLAQLRDYLKYRGTKQWLN